MSANTSHHNATVAAEIAQRVSRQTTNPAASWLHGLAVGIALSERKPLMAHELRHVIERATADLYGESPEQQEVALRAIVDLFAPEP